MYEHHAPLPALDNEARAELISLCRREVVPAHHAIFRDGNRADHYYNITSGIVKLVKTRVDGQHIVGLLYASDFMGQSLKTRHTYAAESATDVDLCVYPKAPFEEFLKTHPELERQIFLATIRELELCCDWGLRLGRKKCSYERVAGFLLMPARRVPKEGALQGNYVPLELPFTRAEMADYLGLTFETVSRQFSKLKKKQVIALLSSRYIVIPDLELLSAVVNRSRTLTKAKAVPLSGQPQQHIRAMGELPT